MMHTLRLIFSIALIKGVKLIQCPDYYDTYFNLNITEFLVHSIDFPKSVEFCPDFKLPENALCCEPKRYSQLNQRFTSKYLRSIENAKILIAYAEKLTDAIVGISELLLEKDNPVVTLDQIRTLKKTMKAFNSDFENVATD